MKTLRVSLGPFPERPFYSEEEIERTCERELSSVGLLPKCPAPVRIDRFIEKRFKVVPKYEYLDAGVLGYTVFGARGVEDIVISRHLSEDEDLVAQRRLVTTLAHEAGHGIFHGHLFVLAQSTGSLFGDDHATDPARVLCRDNNVQPEASHKKYDGRWWEYQANRAIGALLIPRPLVRPSVHDLVKRKGSLQMEILEPTARKEAVERISAIFEVNPVVARIRLYDLFPVHDQSQFCL